MPFIIVAVLLVAALVFAIISFLGKNSESDKKQDAQEELASTRQELADVREQLGLAEESGQELEDVLRTAAGAADDLKSCTDSSRDFIEVFSNAIGQIVAGGGVPPELETAANETDATCATSDESYEELIAAIRALE